MLGLLAIGRILGFRCNGLWNAVLDNQGAECQSAMSGAGREDTGDFGEDGDCVVADQLEVVLSNSLVVDPV